MYKNLYTEGDRVSVLVPPFPELDAVYSHSANTITEPIESKTSSPSGPKRVVIKTSGSEEKGDSCGDKKLEW